MNLAIPTKRDFQENRKQAEYALLEYVALVVFPCNEESDERASRFFELWQSGSIDLYEFWGKYGEIGKHEKAFVDFCVSKIGSGEEWEQRPQKGAFSEDVFNSEEQPDNTGGWSEAPHEATNVADFIEKLKGFLASLPGSTFNKFLVFFLSTRNFIVVNAAKSPSDMPKEVRKSMQKYSGHLAYEKKKAYLDGLYPFWVCLERVLGDKYILSDQKIQQQQYEKLYKAAHITNSSREKKKLEQIISSFFDNFPGQFEEFKEPILKSIMRTPLQTTLQDLPQQVISRRDQMHLVLPDVFKGCSQYDRERLHLIRNEFIKTEKAAINNAYLEHRRTCAQCKQAEEAMREVMAYRYGRLQEIMNKPIYPIHSPNNGQISGANTKGLVRYYTERYHKIPCELHKYYLALAYKQNGDLDKSKTLLASNKTGAPAENLTMGTVLSVYCACGKEDEYHLNALRSPKIAIGRLDKEDPLDIPQINVCQPDGLAMSRDMLTLEYQADRQDGLVHPKQEQAGNLWFLAQDKLFDLLERQIGRAEELNIDYAESFEPLTQDIWLADIAGIGMFREGAVSFEGKLLQGVNHPLLGRLPVGWYIEVKAHRRNKTIMKSFADKSFVE